MNFEKASEQEMTNVGKRGRKAKWPISLMEVGDAITVKRGEYGKASPITYPHTYGRISGKSFSVRQLDDGSFRIIRIG